MSQNCKSHLLPNISTSALYVYTHVCVYIYMCVCICVCIFFSICVKCIMYMRRDTEKDGRLLIHCALDFVYLTRCTIFTSLYICQRSLFKNISYIVFVFFFSLFFRSRASCLSFFFLFHSLSLLSLINTLSFLFIRTLSLVLPYSVLASLFFFFSF